MLEAYVIAFVVGWVARSAWNRYSQNRKKAMMIRELTNFLETHECAEHKPKSKPEAKRIATQMQAIAKAKKK
jgi:hypothetical protein